MLFRTRSIRAVLLCALTSFALLAFLSPTYLRAQDGDSPQPPEKHGRKYKAPPETLALHLK